MARITWDESFSVQVEEIDAQHKKWISIINELHDALITGEGFQTITEKSLQAMLDYASFHFSYEEDYMQKIGYPQLADHKKEHEQFMERITGLMQDREAGRLVLNTEIMKVLTGWLTNHIMQSDKKYSEQES